MRSVPSKKMNVQKLLEEYQQLPEFEGMILTSVNQQGGFNSTPLHIAIYRENPEEVRTLLEAKADPNASGEYGERPLQVAVNCKNRAIIEQLLRAGARTDLQDDKGINTWQFAELLGFEKELDEIVRRVAPNGGSS
jgi:ankyrin repeat protein